jgi:hypothetical protein
MDKTPIGPRQKAQLRFAERRKIAGDAIAHAIKHPARV